jgi:transcriptional regulator with XRE-family HTH domain
MQTSDFHHKIAHTGHVNSSERGTLKWKRSVHYGRLLRSARPAENGRTMSEQATGTGDETARPAGTAEPAEHGEQGSLEERTDAGVIAKRLQHLFENKRRPDGKRYSYREVLAAIDAAGGPTMSIGYLSQLVTGARTNPMMDAVQALAKFFEVPLSYFDAHENTAETNEQLKLIAALQHAGVQDVAMRTVGLPPESVALILGMIDRVRQVEGLPPAEKASGTTE